MRGLVAAMLGGVVAVLALGPAGAASASLGSVPAEVSSYVASGQLVARLANIYGKNGDGSAGLPFGDTTTTGSISRVYQWTADRLVNKATDHPVQLTNNWVVPISIGSKPVGLATVWINPQTVLPELADFDPTASTAVALAAIPATAALVRDSATHAWLALDSGKVTPLVAGTSGLSTASPAPVESLQLSATSAAPVTASDPHTGIGLAIGLVAVVVIILAVALLLPRRRAKVDPVDAATPAVGADPEPARHHAPSVTEVLESAAVAAALVDPPTELAEPEEPVGGAPTAPTAAPATRAPRAVAPKSATPITKRAPSKPAGSKPAGRTATAAATSAKPRVHKRPAQKPPAQKPPAPQPAAEPPTPRSRTPKPPPAAEPPVRKPSTPRPRTPKAPVDPPTEPDT